MTTKKQTAQSTRREPVRITDAHLEKASAANDEKPFAEFKRYEPLPGVIPEARKEETLAMDATPYDMLNGMAMGMEYSGFRGYPQLAAMSQQVEYSNMHNVFADEMTRNWIEIKSRKEGDHDPDIDLMERALEKYDVKRLMHEAVRQDSMFGVAHIYIDTGARGSELSKPLFLDPRKIPKGSLKGLRVVDPTWIYPAMYNTQWPLADNFYQPQSWFVMGETVHESRFMDIVSRPVPDILKPSYCFGGLSLTQLMEDYVVDWRDAKKNVIKILRTLRMRALQTDMDARLEAPGEFDKRIKLFTKYQDNFGIWAIDKEENLLHMQTSLSELSNILSNYQDQLCIPSRITNLKLLGNAPAGLNASGDSELDTWHETVSGYQDGELRRPLENIFKIIQLSEFGEVKDDIYFEFRPLDEISEKERAEIAKLRVETVAVAADSQLVSSEEAREALKGIENAGFETLDGDYEPEEKKEPDSY
ncbi:anti-CBASS protein Acb1 family protein [Raoultella ornithinolytica]|uniref:anti-CBASS protein Acb1 family protein n=1 Tax=Raoultella ornithinolytica TaxID=54291 RepID=UPI003D6E619A